METPQHTQEQSQSKETIREQATKLLEQKKKQYKNQFLNEMKGKTLEELKANPPEMIFILDGDISRRELYKQFKNWTPTSLADEDAHKMVTGAKARFIAGAEILKHIPDVKIVTNSYGPPEEKRKSEEKRPIHAEVTKNYLIHLGVPEQNILMEKESTSTMENIIGIARIAAENDLQNISILTSAHHLPRTKAFYQSLQDAELYERRLAYYMSREKINELLKKHPNFSVNNFFDIIRKLKIDFIAAEDILPHRNKIYQTLLKKWQQTEGYKKRKQGELTGYTQIMTGTYARSNEEIIDILRNNFENSYFPF